MTSRARLRRRWRQGCVVIDMATGGAILEFGQRIFNIAVLLVRILFPFVLVASGTIRFEARGSPGGIVCVRAVTIVAIVVDAG